MERYGGPHFQPDALHSLNESEKALVLSYREFNLRLAGEENEFRAFWHFKKVATGDNSPLKELRPLFSWETPNGMIWHIVRILPGERQFVMKTENLDKHVAIWNRNVVCKLPEDDE